MIKKISSFLPAIVAAGILSTGCNNDIMDKINENPDNPPIVPVNFILPQIIAATATSTVAGDLSLYASTYMELETGVHGQLYNAEVRMGEPTSATTYNNSWGSIYANIRTAKDLIKICDDPTTTDGGPVIKGMAQTLEAMNLATLTNYFGDVPYSQTAVFDETTGMPIYSQPTVDSQKDIYDEIFRLLDEAETNLNETSGAPAADNDMLYGGDTGLWIKAVNALKARYTLQLLHVSENPEADLDSILGYIDNSFASADEQMTFDEYDASETYNPLGAFFYSRYGIGASESFVNLLVAKKDPRISQWSYDDLDLQKTIYFSFDEGWADNVGTWMEDHVGVAPNGSPIESQLYYSYSNAYLAEWAPVHFMSYHELMFIKAEVLVRQERNDEALEALEAAVVAACGSMEYYLEVGMSDDVASEYFINSVVPAFETNALNEVMLQKYIACSGANGEPPVAYNDYRRMKAMGEDDYLTLKNPKNDSQFPLRFSYGADDVTNNKNVFELYGNGQYVYTENVWWAGGTR